MAGPKPVRIRHHRDHGARSGAPGADGAAKALKGAIIAAFEAQAASGPTS